MRFYVDPNNLDLTLDSQQFEHFIAYDGQGNREFLLGVTYNSTLPNGACGRRLPETMA